MTKLFMDNESFDFISLPRLARSYLENESERIELAGFQRGAAWKASNVEALWDSLLRWFPIGSILLARGTEFSDVRSRLPQYSSSGKYTEINKDGIDEEVFILIDGQQRSNTIAMGFLTWNHPKSKEAGARLWLDLGEPENKNNKQYEFYLCTADDPFGERISVSQKRQALEKIEKSDKDDSEIKLDEAYPAKAKLPVPFAEFLQAIKEKKDWDEIQKCMFQDNFLNLSPITLELLKVSFSQDLPRKDIKTLIQAIREVVIEEKYKIPAILFQNRDGHVSSMELFKLFERINVNGVTPPQAELFFSVLKLIWPEIGNFVAEISKDSDLEGLFRPTDIILAAIRLVNPELTELTLSNFERITDEQKRALRELLEHESGVESIFQRCMRLSFNALHYRGGGDYGLPRQLIYDLRQRVWHTILYWIYIHQDEINKDVSNSDRFNIVRFALLDLMDYCIFVGWWRGYSQYVNNRTFNNIRIDEIAKYKKFPTKKIFLEVKNRVKEDEVLGRKVLKILTSDEYKKWISPNNTGEYINWNSHSAGNVFLLFAQREYLEKWESLNDMDKDHIIPYNWMNFSGPTGNNKFWKVDTVGPNGRSSVMNSPGNFRYWPSSLNRQYQDNQPTSKYIESDVSTKLDPAHKKRFLFNVGDVLRASFIDEELLKMIQRIEDMKEGKDHRIWTTEQYNLFKRLVDKRCYKMYQNLYVTMKFDELGD